MFLASKSHRRTRQCLRAVITRQSQAADTVCIIIIINLVKSLSKWKILSNLSFFVIRYIKQILTAFYSGHSLKIIGPRWCQNHEYALSFASGIVMVLTSPRAYNFKCAPQSSQYLYNNSLWAKCTQLWPINPRLTKGGCCNPLQFFPGGS